MKTIDAREVHARSMAEDPEYRAAYEALETEFMLITAMIEVRRRSRLSQAELASRMGTTESMVVRLEGGRANPSVRTLERYAAATGHKLKISFEPISKKSA